MREVAKGVEAESALSVRTATVLQAVMVFVVRTAVKSNMQPNRVFGGPRRSTAGAPHSAGGSARLHGASAISRKRRTEVRFDAKLICDPDICVAKLLIVHDGKEAAFVAARKLP